MNLLARHSLSQINKAKEAYLKTGHGPARLVLEHRIRRKCKLLLDCDMPKNARLVLDSGTALTGGPNAQRKDMESLRSGLFREFEPLIESCESAPQMKGAFITMTLMLGYVSAKAYFPKSPFFSNYLDNALEAAFWSHIFSHAAYFLKRSRHRFEKIKSYFSSSFSIIGPAIALSVGAMMETLQYFHLYQGGFWPLDYACYAAGAIIGYATGQIAVHDTWVYKDKFRAGQ